MNASSDFEDMLRGLERHKVEYLIIGGYAVSHYADFRTTKDMDILVEGSPANTQKANMALAEFGSPYLLEPNQPTEVMQVGLPPNRIDFLQTVEGLDFAEAWKQRERALYGDVEANWISIHHLLAVKERIDKPRHQEDARVLRKVIELRQKKR